MARTCTSGGRRGRAVTALLAAAVTGGALVALPAAPASAIVNGGFAANGEYPWMAAVSSKEGVCGGTLVAPRVVLTARHCFDVGNEGLIRVSVAGDQVTRTGGFYAEATEVRYEPRSGGATYSDAGRWDVALLMLDRPVPVEPVRLATVRELPLVQKDMPVRVIGWGTTIEGDNPATTSEVENSYGVSELLKYADVSVGDPALGPSQFPGIYDKNRFDPELDIIEKTGEGDQHSCAGDSGGPMVVDAGGGNWLQVANLSFGNCQDDDGYIMSWNRLIDGPHREWLDRMIDGEYGYVRTTNADSPGTGLVRASSPGPEVTPSVTRTGTGTYRVDLPGIGSAGGVAHVTAASPTSGRCWLDGWQDQPDYDGGDEHVLVSCATLGGAPANLAFSMSYALPLGLSRSMVTEFAQLWADQPTATAYTPRRSHVRTSNGRTPRVTRVATGDYRVELPGFDGYGQHEGVAIVSANGGPRDCVSEQVDRDIPASVVTVSVRCTVTAADGTLTPTDSRFSLSYLLGTGLRNVDEGTWAYVRSDRPLDATSTPAVQGSSTGTTARVDRTSSGTYVVTLPRLAAANAVAHVSAGERGAACTARPRVVGRDQLVDVSCYRQVPYAGSTLRAAMADVPFTLVLDSAPLRPKTFSDFDGDGKKDLAVFRPSNGTWYGINSSNGAKWSYAYGRNGDIPVPADYDGDGRTDLGIARKTGSSGLIEWHWIESRTGTTRFEAARWSGTPVPGDHDGDGKAERAVYTRTQAGGSWHYVSTLHGRYSGTIRFGNQEDRPVPGHWDRDGVVDHATFRPSTGTWHRSTSWNGVEHDGVQWGASTDKLVPADYDGDGTTDYAVFRPADGTWHVTHPDVVTQFGVGSDVPMAGDYDGDRMADVAVWRPSNGTWYRINSSTKAHAPAVAWGASGDIPLL